MRSQTTERYAAYCPQCGRERRITEPNAFGGRDKLRMTLSCGHIINKEVSSA
jgi:rRNA maturation protein Nop10